MMLDMMLGVARKASKGFGAMAGRGGAKRRRRRRSGLSAKDLAIAQQIAGSIGKTAAANYILKVAR